MMTNRFISPAALCIAMAATVLSSCEKSAEIDNSKNEELQIVNEQFVDDVVIPTYKTLADKSLSLYDAVTALRTSKTDAAVDKACGLWRDARQYWEWSESFLFGAASKYFIDPHIDTWPLDKVALDNLLGSEKMMNDIENVVANLNNGLVGFHGLEYIIFREGENRPAAQISGDELKYAEAVAKDLALSCARLEAAWAGIDEVSDRKAGLIEEAELEPEDNFGEQMKLCGQAGSVWKSITAGSEQIIEGCKDIIDEVGNSKIGKPYTGEDVNYIESPHSWNSITDFYDNVVSIRSAYFGKLGAETAQTHSVSAFVRKADAKADQDVIDALSVCLSKIDAMPRPFVKNYKDARVGEAVDACNALNDALEAARQVLVNE